MDPSPVMSIKTPFVLNEYIVLGLVISGRYKAVGWA